MSDSEHENDGSVPILPVNSGDQPDEDLVLQPRPAEEAVDAVVSPRTTLFSSTGSVRLDEGPTSAAETCDLTGEEELHSDSDVGLRRSISSSALEVLRTGDESALLSRIFRRNNLPLSGEQRSDRNVTDAAHAEEHAPSSARQPGNVYSDQSLSQGHNAADLFVSHDHSSVTASYSELSGRALPSDLQKDEADKNVRVSHPPLSPDKEQYRDGFLTESGLPLPSSPPELRNASKKSKRIANALPCFKFDSSGRATVAKITTAEILAESRVHGSRGTADAVLAAESEQAPLGTQHRAEWRMRKKDRKRLQAALRGVLQSRDLRQIHPTTRPKPLIIVRRHVIVVSLVHLRAVIFAEQLLLFNPDDHMVRQSARSMEERLTAAQSEGDPEIPFELHALEAILIEVCVALERDLACIEPSLMRLLNEITHKIGGRKLEEMLYLKQMLSNFSARVDGVRDALQDLLAEDEDMARMYLTEMKKHPETERPPAAHEQVEELLESYLRVLDHLSSRAKLLGATIDDTEGLVDLQLDSMRNRILRISVLMTVLTCVFAGAGVVNRFFSMNLQLPIYGTNSVWFIGFVAITAFTVPLTIVALYWWARLAGILSA
jgi:magnesium transporter